MLKLIVHRKTVEADGICAFELRDADGRPLPSFEAGAHIDVHLPGGAVRQYSLCGMPGAADFYRIGVLRDPASRGGSIAMHDSVNHGDEIVISEPRNHFPLDEDAPASLLFAGGIGITPILAMARRLHQLGREFQFHYAARTRSRAAFLQEIEDGPFRGNVHLHFDDGPDDQKLNLAAVLREAGPLEHLYVCGPKGFLDAVRASAADNGFDAARVHYEYFGGAEPHSAADRHFEVVINSTGKVIRVEAHQTVVEALEENGVAIDTACRQGACGTCLTRVLEGEIDHKDFFLTPEEQAENNQFTPCCSRAKSARLVLDI
jgi:vanillate O-demethylase ferredoxin subunit